MNQTSLRKLNTYLLCASQFVTILSILFLYARQGFTAEEKTIAIGLVSPMFAGSLTTAIRFTTANRFKTDKGKTKVTTEFAAIVISLIVLTSSALIATIFLKAYSQTFSTFGTFVNTVLGIESLAGASLGMMIPAVYTDS